VTDDPYHRRDLALVPFPDLLRPLGVSATIRASSGGEALPPGLKTVIGTRH
jgi:hypothetical protein